MYKYSRVMNRRLETNASTPPLAADDRQLFPIQHHLSRHRALSFSSATPAVDLDKALRLLSVAETVICDLRSRFGRVDSCLVPSVLPSLLDCSGRPLLSYRILLNSILPPQVGHILRVDTEIATVLLSTSFVCALARTD
jgi:hypothetical protein